MIFMSDLKLIEKTKTDILNLIDKDKKVSINDIRNKISIDSSLKANTIRCRAIEQLIKEDLIYKNQGYYCRKDIDTQKILFV